ncbi:hypothetical protein AERO9A_350052 [Aeromonas salmonicida]|nr:hypothetical protein AERO9A_350052 [Aeromonas salmonicida]
MQGKAFLHGETDPLALDLKRITQRGRAQEEDFGLWQQAHHHQFAPQCTFKMVHVLDASTLSR